MIQEFIDFYSQNYVAILFVISILFVLTIGFQLLKYRKHTKDMDEMSSYVSGLYKEIQDERAKFFDFLREDRLEKNKLFEIIKIHSEGIHRNWQYLFDIFLRNTNLNLPENRMPEINTNMEKMEKVKKEIVVNDSKGIINEIATKDVDGYSDMDVGQ